MINRLFLLLISFLLPAVIFAQQWINNYNGSANSNDVSNKVVVDASGYVYTCGYSTNLLSGMDITTIKYNSAGVQQWAAIYSGPGNNIDEAYAITIDDAGNVYVAGTCTNPNTGKDIVVIKYNSSGVQQWVAQYTNGGNYTDEAYAITIDASANVFIAGKSYSDTYGDEFTVIKYGSSGAQQWIKTFNGNNGNHFDEAYAITIDAIGNVIATGTCETLNANDIVTIAYSTIGVQLWNAVYNNINNNGNDEAYAITIDEAANIYVTGSSEGNGTGKDYITLKYNSLGQELWKVRYNNAGANSDDIPSAIAFTHNSNSLVVTGSSMASSASNSEDYFTIRYNLLNGNVLDSARYNELTGNNRDIAYSIASPNSNNSIFIAGSCRFSSAPGSEDIVVIKYNPNLNFQELSRIPNNGPDAAFSTVVNNTNNDLFIAGYFSSPASGFNMGSAKYESGNLISIKNLSDEVPDGYKLEQNFPNPFNPVTTIRFSIPQTGVVKLLVYDMLGRIVENLVNNRLNPGKYEVTFGSNNLSSGIYVYKLSSGTYSEMKKMILVK